MKQNINKLMQMQSCEGCINQKKTVFTDISNKCFNCSEMTINTGYDDGEKDKEQLKDDLISLLSELMIISKDIQFERKQPKVKRWKINYKNTLIPKWTRQNLLKHGEKPKPAIKRQTFF